MPWEYSTAVPNPEATAPEATAVPNPGATIAAARERLASKSVLASPPTLAPTSEPIPETSSEPIPETSSAQTPGNGNFLQRLSLVTFLLLALVGGPVGGCVVFIVISLTAVDVYEDADETVWSTFGCCVFLVCIVLATLPLFWVRYAA